MGQLTCSKLLVHLPCASLLASCKPALSALKQDLKSALTSLQLGNTQGEGHMGFVVCTVRVTVLFLISIISSILCAIFIYILCNFKLCVMVSLVPFYIKQTNELYG
jgi:type IV secretory pathway VirB6-like protein